MSRVESIITASGKEASYPGIPIDLESSSYCRCGVLSFDWSAPEYSVCRSSDDKRRYKICSRNVPVAEEGWLTKLRAMTSGRSRLKRRSQHLRMLNGKSSATIGQEAEAEHREHTGNFKEDAAEVRKANFLNLHVGLRSMQEIGGITGKPSRNQMTREVLRLKFDDEPGPQLSP